MLACCCSGLWSCYTPGGLLVAQVHVDQELSDPILPGRTSSASLSSQSCARLLTVTALRHQTSDTRMMCSTSVLSVGESKVLLPSGTSAGALFPVVRSVPVDPVEHPWAQALDVAQAPLRVPLSFRLPLVRHVDEPVAHDGSA